MEKAGEEKTYRHHPCRISWRLPWTQRSDRRWADPPLLRLFLLFSFFLIVFSLRWRRIQRRRRRRRKRKQETNRLYRMLNDFYSDPGLGSFLLTRRILEISITPSFCYINLRWYHQQSYKPPAWTTNASHVHLTRSVRGTLTVVNSLLTSVYCPFMVSSLSPVKFIWIMILFPKCLQLLRLVRIHKIGLFEEL